MTDLQIIGGGQMGQALAAGLIAAGWIGDGQLTIVELSEAQRESLAERFPSASVVAAPIGSVDALVAVKPHFVAEVCESIPTPARVLSIAAGITVATIEACVPPGTPVLRAMPNTPALLGAGAAGIAGGTSSTDADLAWGQSILNAVGTAEIVTEVQLDAVTGLSGSGPAYVFLIAEALVDGAVNAGLPRETAKVLAHQTLLGAARMLVDTDLPASELRANVTTPAGTTAAGLQQLEQAGVRAAFSDAIGAATARATELGKAAADG